MKMNKNKKGLARLNGKPLFKIRQLQCLLYLSFLLNIISILALLAVVKVVSFLLGIIVTFCFFVFIYCAIRFAQCYK